VYAPSGLALAGPLSFGASKRGEEVKGAPAADYNLGDSRPSHNHPTVHLRSDIMRRLGSFGPSAFLLPSLWGRVLANVSPKSLSDLALLLGIITGAGVPLVAE
jgi:hypothetical protein